MHLQPIIVHRIPSEASEKEKETTAAPTKPSSS